MNKTIRMKNVTLSLVTIAFFLGFIPAVSFAGSWNGWIYQDPYPTSNNLFAVKFVTPQKGWVAGEQGAILYTEDGGNTWEIQESGTEKTIKSLSFVNERQGWAVGGADGSVMLREKGMILHTADGGKTWVEQQGDFDSTLNSVFFLNEKEGWIAGNGGVVLHTTDGGNRWERQNIGVMRHIANVYFINAQTGWLLAGDRIFRTTDGGKQWSEAKLDIQVPQKGYLGRGLSEPIPNNWNSGELYFVNEKKGWIVTGLSPIFFTQDGGKTWTNQFSAKPLDYFFRYLSFINEKKGCVSGSDIICTEDGGKTWQRRLGSDPKIGDDLHIKLSGISFVNQSVGWAVGLTTPKEGGLIMKTADGGKIWQPVSKWNECGHGTFFLNNKTGWLYDSYPSQMTYICRSDDGGHTWKKQDVGIEVSNIHFTDSRSGWAVGCLKQPGKVWSVIKYTHDGGQTWQIQYKNVAGNDSFFPGLQGVYFLNHNIGWAVGFNDAVLYTTNGGATWKLQHSGKPKIHLTDVQFIDPNEGWILAYTYEDEEAGYILHSSDGGNHWQTQSIQSSGLNGIFIKDSTSGWVTGSTDDGYGWLLHTTNDGKAWLRKDFPRIGFNYPIFLDKNKGVVYGDKGWVMVTTDGGIKWTKMRTPLSKYPWHFSEVFTKAGK